MRAYLDAMDARALRPAAARRAALPRVLAALRPRMLGLARDRTHGAHPYLTTPRHSARAREVLGAGPVLAPEQGFVLEADPAKARAVAREHLAPYLKLPNYVNSWREEGFEDADVADGGSDRLVDALIAWGDEAAVAARVREHLDAGADHVCVQPVDLGLRTSARRAAGARAGRALMPRRRPVTIDDVRALALQLPRTTEALVRDRVKFRIGSIVYLAFSRDETIMGFAFPRDERPLLVESEPDKFMFPSQSDLRYNWVLVRLDAIDREEMRELVIDAWRMCVPKRVAAELEAAGYPA